MQKRDLYYDRIPTKLLRENVRYLGNILGKVLKDQEGEKFFRLVEKVRKLSKANKTNFQHYATASMIQVRLTNEALTPPDVLGLSGISMDTQKKKAQTTVEAVNAQQRNKSRQS